MLRPRQTANKIRKYKILEQYDEVVPSKIVVPRWVYPISNIQHWRKVFYFFIISISDTSIFMLRKSSVIRDEVVEVDVVVDVDVVDSVN